MRHVPEIKLIRTDTTLDLSQKAEKVCLDFECLEFKRKGLRTFHFGREQNDGSDCDWSDCEFLGSRRSPGWMAERSKALV